MAKNILVTYYTQSGQLEEIVKNLTQPFRDQKEEYTVTYYHIQPKIAFPFPWPKDVFFNTFPESYLMEPVEIEKPSDEILNQDYDLIIFGYQVWFLTPSIPIISFLKSPYAKQLMGGKPLITVSGTRNMWMLSQEKLKVYFKELNVKLVGNIALVDRHDNYTSVITILNWLQTGNKVSPKPWPKAGVSDEEIREVGKYGNIILPYLSNGNYEGLQKELVANGAVEIRPFLVKVEKVGNKLFTVFSRIIRNNPEKRKFWVSVYKFYLMVAIWVISPIVLLLFILTTPIFWWKRKKNIEYFQGI
jgi:hypothetical protein